MALSSCYELELKGWHKGSNTYPRAASVATAATAGHIAVDGGGDQRREVAGGERTIRRPEEAELGHARVKGFGKFSKI